MKEKFIQLKRFLKIKEAPEVETGEIKNLKNLIADMQIEVQKHKKFNQLIDNENKRLTHRINKLQNSQEDQEKKLKESKEENQELKCRLERFEKIFSANFQFSL